MKPLAVIQPGYSGIETIALLDCQTIRKDFYVPLHVGTVEYMQGVFDKLGLDVKPLGYPESLIPFLNRYMHLWPLYEVARYSETKGMNLFIKPYRYKAFDVTDSDSLIVTNTNVWDMCHAQEIVQFDQEYRVYCIGDKIVGHGRYDCNDSDDLNIVEVYHFCEQVMKAWTTKPAAYAIDVGRIVDRGLSIVELTDAWAIGHYKPMSFEMYSKMLQVRWNQIMEGVL